MYDALSSFLLTSIILHFYQDKNGITKHFYQDKSVLRLMVAQPVLWAKTPLI